MDATLRAAWAADIFKDESKFLAAQERGETAGLELKYGPDGIPYLDEGECEGPFA